MRQLAEGCPNIRFLGHLTAERLQTIYRDAVAIVVPSVCYEMFAQVIIEAFRVGTPAVVRNIGGMPELIDESGGGFTYDTEEGLRAALDALVADPSLRDEMGARALQAYRDRWTPEVHINRYLELIGEIERERAGRNGREEA